MTSLPASHTSVHTRRQRLAIGGVVSVLLMSALGGCGSQSDDSPSSAQDPSDSTGSTGSIEPSPSSEDSATARASGARLAVGDQVKAGQAVIVSVSNVKAPITPLASALPDDKSVDMFLDSLDPRLGADVREAITAAQVPAGSVLFGSVVAVGCDQPLAVEVATTFEGLETTGVMPKSGVQCLVPVTSVALFVYES